MQPCTSRRCYGADGDKGALDLVETATNNTTLRTALFISNGWTELAISHVIHGRTLRTRTLVVNVLFPVSYTLLLLCYLERPFLNVRGTESQRNYAHV